ncbi:phosphoglycerate kinase [Sulfobacillus acidophilus]|uniref:Phosphoglycerate kinase n=1 Tax=Sulfobacillus acidophilus TaxID=53633 RepID=A0ABS3AVT6_9FIRM|nr:phosphoglycerate kinase [Sulfobacillus acidophilus]
MAIKWIDELEFDFSGKRVFCRFDLNVPLNEDGSIADESRIMAILPTLSLLMKAGAKVVIASHLGRPKGKPRAKLSLKVVAIRLQELLKKDLIFAEDCVGDGVALLSLNLANGSVLMLENLRFHSGEEKNDADFAKSLLRLADVYVNDAFGAVHRGHASVCALPKLFKVTMGGLLLKKELNAFKKVKNNPEQPFVAILGGAKVSDKIGVIGQLLQKANKIIIGGAMAYTFLKAQGENIGASRVEEDKITIANSILRKAKEKSVKIVLPIDHVVAADFNEKAKAKVIDSGQFAKDEMGLDIGPKSCEEFAKAIPAFGTIFWNGPMGVYEWEAFSKGTFLLMRAIARSRAYSVVGGGDSIAALNKGKMASEISHVSTGGGAGLEFLEGAKCPGLLALGYEF